MENVMPIIPDISQVWVSIEQINIKYTINLKFDVICEYYCCAFGDKIQYMRVHKTKQWLKRIFKANKGLEYSYHEKCTNLKFKEFRESAHLLILEIKKNFISAVEIFMY